MVSKFQSEEAQVSKGQSKDLAVSNMVSSPVVEYKSGKPNGKATIEMQSDTSVLTLTRVPLVDKKWTQLPKDLKEQIWEAVQMVDVVGKGSKKMVLSSAAKKLNTSRAKPKKYPVSDKASCSNVRPLVLEEENPTNDADAAEKWQDEMDLSKLDMPPPLLTLCQFVKTKLKAANKTVRVHILEEVFGTEHDTFLLCEDILQFASMVEIESITIAVYMRYLFDYLKMANLVGLVDPGQVSSQSGAFSYQTKHLSNRLKNADGDQFFLVPYNPGGHWVLVIVRPAKETVYYVDSLPNRFADEDMRNIVNT
ncbi:hypothetical protein L3X38_033045 [Prunus dulcis]|uniref:Ubiquitin-like protease family profile domain-containing protein n=1 Tax=Prunus dulcis TaxID=3755 RepID=A0AAD4VHJ8_PRUDU|nr:hypothetical protein L3X38_033045 [Prunus dulcis]